MTPLLEHNSKISLDLNMVSGGLYIQGLSRSWRVRVDLNEWQELLGNGCDESRSYNNSENHEEAD